MTKLMKKRIEIIIDAMKTEGIEFDNSYFMTMWSLACYINNNLYYKHFTTGKKNKIFRKGLRALDSHEILALYPAIRRTVSKSDKLQLEKNNDNSFINNTQGMYLQLMKEVKENGI